MKILFSLALIVSAALVAVGQERAPVSSAAIVEDGLRLAADKSISGNLSPGFLCGSDTKSPWRGVRIEDGNVVAANLISEIGGYAREASVTGGLGGELMIVTDARDYDPQMQAPAIPGTLRDAVERAARLKHPVWIAFSPVAGAMRIQLTSPLRLSDNMTLDGSCADVTIEATERTGLLYIFDRRNIIITRLQFRKTDYVPGVDNPEAHSCVRLNGAFDAVAIIHNDLERCGDGAIDITTSPHKPVPDTARATVAFNRIAEHDKTMLFGTFTCGPSVDSGVPCGATELERNRSSQPNLYLTLEGNEFLRTSQRHPRVFGRVMAHVVNNIVAVKQYRRPDGRPNAIYGTFVSNGARALVEGNAYLRLDDLVRGPMEAVFTTATPGAPKMRWDTTGFIRLSGNRTAGPAIVAENEPGLVAEPSYRQKEKALSLEALPLSQAIACVAQRAGRLGSTGWNEALCQPSR